MIGAEVSFTCFRIEWILCRAPRPPATKTTGDQAKDGAGPPALFFEDCDASVPLAKGSFSRTGSVREDIE
jgi:hypothetical protein